MRFESCSECSRLRRDYTSAKAAYLERKEQMGMVLHDSGLYEIAKRATEVAEKHQEAARIKIEEHQRFHDRSSAATAGP
jgi:hypothetical protein